MIHAVTNESDDSDDSLPVLCNIAESCTTGISKRDISKGDIVWAKFKALYWPALVRAVYKKEKKFSVWFTDDPGKTFKLPSKYVYPFNDREMRLKIQKDVKEAGCVQEHEGLTSHAVTYLRRRAEGYVDDPMKFFDQTYPFYLVEEFLQKNPGADISSIKIPPLYISHEKKIIRKSVNAKKSSCSDLESEKVEVESESSESELDATIEDAPKDYLSEVFRAFASSSSEDENIDKIVEFVKSGKADDYLKKVLTKRVRSKHRDAYESEIKSYKKCTNSLTFTGPINDDKKLRELVFYLLPLYNKMRDTTRSKDNSHRIYTRKGKIFNYPSFHKFGDNAQYVASVWLPEAIIYAMSHVYNVSLKHAKQLFEKNSVCGSAEIERLFSQLFSGATTSDSKVVKQKSTGQDDGNISSCAPLKKIRIAKGCVKKTK